MQIVKATYIYIYMYIKTQTQKVTFEFILAMKFNFSSIEHGFHCLINETDSLMNLIPLSFVKVM